MMKDRIAKTAIALFHVRGIKFTMSDLARDLGVSKSTLYEHFPSKDALIGYIVEQINEEAQIRFREIIENSNLTVPEKLKGILLIVPKDFEHSFLRLFIELRRYHPEQWTKIEQGINEEWEVITGLVEEGINSGVLRSMDTPVLIQTLKTLMKSIFEQGGIASNQITIQESLAMMVDIVLYGIISKD